MVGAGNAVNLTDGLDGLATMPVIIACRAPADMAAAPSMRWPARRAIIVRR